MAFAIILNSFSLFFGLSRFVRFEGHWEKFVVIAEACNTRFSTPAKRNIDLSGCCFFYGIESEKFAVLEIKSQALHCIDFFVYSLVSRSEKKLNEEGEGKPNGLKFIRRQIGNCEDFLLHVKAFPRDFPFKIINFYDLQFENFFIGQGCQFFEVFNYFSTFFLNLQ